MTSQGKIVGVSKIARNITARKSAEGRLAEQARLLDLTNDADFRYQTCGTHYFLEPAGAFKELYGYSAEEALGKSDRNCCAPNFPNRSSVSERSLFVIISWSGELVHRCKDGSKVVVMSRWSLDRDERGKPLSILEQTPILLRARKPRLRCDDRSNYWNCVFVRERSS